MDGQDGWKSGAPSLERQSSGRDLIPQIVHKLKMEYSVGRADSSVKLAERLIRLFEEMQSKRVSVRYIIEEAGKIINQYLKIREVIIGLKNQKDGKYHYEIFVGMRKNSEMAYKKLEYTYNDFFDNEKWKHYKISRFTAIFFAEDEPYVPGEEASYNRPLMLKKNRETIDQSVEGDCIQTLIIGLDNELVGWVEISGTKDNKIPSASTIKWIELIAQFLALYVQCERAGTYRRLSGKPG